MIVIYQKPTCSTCRSVYAALKESGVDFDAAGNPVASSTLEGLRH
jgi:arsenate reductase-like glutaredoxin family protein